LFFWYFSSFLLILILFSVYLNNSPPALTLATTTSLADTGLLEHILPGFEEENDVKVKVVAVGTGQAIKLGERGDADIILVHDREREEKFLTEGHGINREMLMYNDFVVVGPENDPAQIKGMRTVEDTFLKMAQMEDALFLSRGDESGTHTKEKEIWEIVSIKPDPLEQSYRWIDENKEQLRGRYESIGQGMGETLNTANEKLAYTLTDRGTYLAQRGLEIVILFEGNETLINPYGVIAVSPQRHPHVKHELAMKLIDYLLSYPTQRKIGEFGENSPGQPLFFPAIE